jgi:hypothetical protein
VKPTPDIYRVKHSLNLIYILTAATLLYEAASAAEERRRLSRIEAAKKATRDADDVASYKLKIWFESHARHTWDESSKGKFLLRRTAGSIAAAPNREPGARSVAEMYQGKAALLRGGTRLGRPSFYNGAPYRRGAC